MAGKEQWYCEKCCRKVDATKKIDLWMLPPILILHLKRITFNANTGKLVKIGRLLSSPPSVDLSEYCSSPQQQGATYDIVCVANHKGRASDGHYTASCLVGDQWFRFDDDAVRHTGKEVLSPDSYVIFLVRQSERGVHDHGHHTPWLRQQSISHPEAWGIYSRAVRECSDLRNELEKAIEASSSSTFRRHLSPRVEEGGYVMALPDVDVSEAAGPEVADPPESASHAHPNDMSCLRVILKLLCGV